MNVLTGIGRVLFSLIFVLSGVSKIMNWSASEQYLVTSMLDMLSHTYEQSWAQNLFDQLIPHASKLLALGAAAEIIGGLLVLLGIQVRLGALILTLFMIPTTLLFHSFWMLEAATREMQMIHFMKNLSILGGCFILMGCGSGGAAKQSKKSE